MNLNFSTSVLTGSWLGQGATTGKRLIKWSTPSASQEANGTVMLAATGVEQDITIRLPDPHLVTNLNLAFGGNPALKIGGSWNIRQTLGRLTGLQAFTSQSSSGGVNAYQFALNGRLADLPQSLRTLFCANNQSVITGSINGTLLTTLNVSGTNSIVAGNPAGSNLISLYTANTQSQIVASLFDLPASMWNLDLSNSQAQWQPGDLGQFALPAASGLKLLNVADLNLSQAVVDNTIDAIHQYRMLWTTNTPVLRIGGNNAAPSAAALAKINELKTDPNGDGFKKWTIFHS